MRTSKFTEEQIGFALRQGDLGTPVAEVCCKMRTRQTIPAIGPGVPRLSSTDYDAP